MIWVVLIGLAGGATWLNQRQKNQEKAVYIDPQMPNSIKAEVLSAIAFETQPQPLYDFANAIESQYPIAAYELRCRAWVLSGRKGDFPVPPQPPQPRQYNPLNPKAS